MNRVSSILNPESRHGTTEWLHCDRCYLQLFEREGRREKILEGRGREKLAAMKKDAAAKQEAIAAAEKAGKPRPVFEPEDIVDSVYNLPFRPGQIIPPEQAVKKETGKEKLDALHDESIKQYNTWVADEEEEMRHRVLPSFFAWQVEDDGVGTIVTNMAGKVPRNRGIPPDESISAEEEIARTTVPVIEYQLGVDEFAETDHDRPNSLGTRLVSEPVIIPMDFAAGVKGSLVGSEKQPWAR